MKRRTFLQRGLVGGVLLAGAGALGLGVWPSLLERRPRRLLQVLDERRFAVVAAVAARVVQAPGADPIEIAHRVDDILALSVPEVQHDLRQLVLLFENALAGLLLDLRWRRPQPFTRLSPEAQDAVLESWRDSKLLVRRSGYAALRKLTLAAHYSQPSTWASVGYPGPPQLSVPT